MTAMGGKFIEIKPSSRQLAYITHEEAWRLLKLDQDLWAEALKRGKAFTRVKNQRQQEAAYFEKHSRKDPGMTGQWDDPEER